MISPPDTTTVLQSLAINTGVNNANIQAGEQIVLRFTHAANSSTVTSAYDLVDISGNIITVNGQAQTFTFTNPLMPATIFSDEIWTRAQVGATSAATDPSYLTGAYGTLQVDASGNYTYQTQSGR